jgi:hypothetical protein
MWAKLTALNTAIRVAGDSRAVACLPWGKAASRKHWNIDTGPSARPKRYVVGQNGNNKIGCFYQRGAENWMYFLYFELAAQLWIHLGDNQTVQIKNACFERSRYSM